MFRKYSLIYLTILNGIVIAIVSTSCKPKKINPKKETPTQLQSKLSKWEKDLTELESEYRKRLDIVGKMGALSKKLAVGYTKMARYELAAQEYHKAIQYESGQQANQSYYKKAKAYYQKTFLYAKVDDDLLYQAGLVYANSSMALGWEPQALQVAVNLFNGLLKKNGKDVRSLFQLAVIYYQGYKKPEKALKYCKALLALEPNDIPTLEMVGQIYYTKKQHASALFYYSKALHEIEVVAKNHNQDLKSMRSYQNVKAIVENLQAVSH